MDEKSKKLKDLKSKMEKDNTLPLKKGATRLVFGDGNADTEIRFIGEGPGYWEDQKGIPFVGNAGSLLNQLLSAIKIKREDVFITNVVHHRPPGNRDPEPVELKKYGKYLDEIIEIIDPKVIVTLGRFSMAKFLPDVRISSVHGKVFTKEFKGNAIWVVPMYHPAAGLRATAVKDALFADFRKLPKILEEIEEDEEGGIEEKEDSVEQMSLV